MDFLKEYGSSDSEAMDSDDSRSIEGELSENTASISDLHGRAVQQVYLITYSQADFQKFPTRESFAKAVVRSFEGTDTKVLLWVCCKEPRQSKRYHCYLRSALSCTIYHGLPRSTVVIHLEQRQYHITNCCDGRPCFSW